MFELIVYQRKFFLERVEFEQIFYGFVVGMVIDDDLINFQCYQGIFYGCFFFIVGCFIGGNNIVSVVNNKQVVYF